MTIYRSRNFQRRVKRYCRNSSVDAPRPAKTTAKSETLTAMKDEALLQQILDRLTQLERKIDYMANPLAQVNIEEKATIIKGLIASGDRRKLRATIKEMNRR